MVFLNNIKLLFIKNLLIGVIAHSINIYTSKSLNDISFFKFPFDITENNLFGKKLLLSAKLYIEESFIISTFSSIFLVLFYFLIYFLFH